MTKAASFDHHAWHDAAVQAWGRRDLVAAVQAERCACEQAPDVALYHSNLCHLLRLAGSLDEAVFHGQRATALDPGFPDAHCHLGMARHDRLELDAAIACQRRALALDPDRAVAHFELAKTLLLAGRMTQGWMEYEWRFAIPGVAPPAPWHGERPQWDGAPMPGGTLLLVADQGYGDVIQFCRYIPAAVSRCAGVVVACSPEMLPIVAQMAGGAPCVTQWEDVGQFDAWCALSGLPGRLGTTLDSIPAADSYLAAEPGRVAAWRQRLDQAMPQGHRRVGLVWAGRPTHANDANRSLRLAQLAPVAQVPGVALVSLQTGAAIHEIDAYPGAAPLVNAGAAVADFADTMAIIANLECVVTVDTAVAHLAGAMGCPVALLLPYAPDWRWLLGRRDTPWYPGVALYRQPAPRQWDAPVVAVARDLAARR
ncbi:tetratricopeptide repeat-containing glycosyltransferase family protein [Bordetella bronchialis]|uniref:Uncharacterized protein n=1 Tax=Bordetella bronchialis TaxID=463025 RepID=A0A193FVF7_9BORD|nr:tetratricopeptide repeat-containing glycosyltransferase family protein [Bordetella bronchialis]ANN71323.1 hypothetical protein BAU08_08235 [Bordetella bronchialis]